MNNARRNALNKMAEALNKTADQLGAIEEEETEAINGLTESLRGSEQAKNMEAAADYIQQANKCIEEVIFYLQEAAK